jgi:ABC-type sugar transport system ATPase subunit
MKKLAALIVGNSNYDQMEMENLSSMVREKEVFALRDFTSYGKFQDVNLTLRQGEIVGLAGLRGSGRTELFKSIIGEDPHDKGSILLEGVEKRYRSPAAACNDGVLYLTEERESEGVVSIASIKQNITASVLPKISRFGVIQGRKENKWTDELIKVLDIKAVSREQEIGQLSGGNKQKVLVAKIMAHAPKVCLLDEPTRGVDIEAKESILNTINRELRKQSCVLISSPGVEDLIKICDRILVLYQGRIIDQFRREEFSEQEIYRAMQGELIHSNNEVSNL